MARQTGQFGNEQAEQIENLYLSEREADVVVRVATRSRRRFAWMLLMWIVPACLPAATVQPQDSPRALVQSVTGEVLGALRDRDGESGGDRAKLVALIENRVLPYFDFRLMAAQVLGYHWRRADEAQREAFTGAFKQLLTNTYAAVFDRYSNQSVEVLEAQDIGTSGRVTVPTHVKTPGEQDIQVDYRLYRHNGKWQVYDVVVDGISLLINYRSEYSRILQQNSLDDLIARLREKNATFLDRSR
jgi:phospholipid transport system substrate-binding protein